MGLAGAVLLSRQGLRPHGKQEWVRQTVKAVEWIKEHNLTLVSSVGTATWELITAIGAIKGCRLKLIIPVKPGEELELPARFWSEQLHLSEVMTEFLECPPVRPYTDKAAQMYRRDQMVCALADILLPVSVRPNGTVAKMLQESAAKGKQVDEDFMIQHESPQEKFAYVIDPDRLNPEIRRLGNDYLIHWTRSCNSAWPGETLISYYHDIIRSESYPRSAFAGLMNIVLTRKIVATSKHMPDQIATVAFSRQAPPEMVPIMRWRSRYRQMSFEPYGIGFPARLAEELGVRRVTYVDTTGDARMKADSVVRWLTQSRGRHSDWSVEQEYRYKGDFSLENIDPSELILICRTSDEAAEAARRTGLQAVPFTLD